MPADWLASLRVAPEIWLLLAGAASALAVVALLAPSRQPRSRTLLAGAAGLGGLLVAAAVPDVAAVAVVILVLAAAQGAMAGRRPFAERLRAPGFAAVLLVAGALLLRAGAGETTARLAALTLGLGVVAVAGLVPFLPAMEVRERAAASPLAWTGFFGPVLAAILAGRIEPLLPPAGVPVFGALLVGLGLLNVAWGGIGAWLVEDNVAAWRYSFLADWGLALIGFGVVVHDGVAAALLILLTILLVRVPLYAWSRPVLVGDLAPTDQASRLVIAAVLAGAPPFAGFAARALLLRAAASVYAPLAVVVGLGMLLYLAHGFRLARTVAILEGRPALGIVIALAAAVLLGVAPALVLGLAGF